LNNNNNNNNNLLLWMRTVKCWMVPNGMCGTLLRGTKGIMRNAESC